jgi:type I restriction enzyme S subunit
MVVKPRGISVDLDYLKHLFQGGLDLTAVITGAAQPQITRQSLAPLKVRFPSILEQRRIAAILDQADALRVKRREALAQFDSLIRSIFIEMFGDPETNTKGFETTKFSALCKRVTDGTHQSPTWSAVGHPFLFVSNIVSGEIDFDTKKFISEETHDELTRRCPIEVGDVLYSTVGSYGVPVVVRTSRKFAFQRHIAHIKPNPDLLDSEFLCAMLDSPSLRKQADRVARGVAQKTVNLSDIGNFLVFKPPLKLQQEFANRAAMAASLKTANLASFAELDALFASLQHRAFRGEL